MSKADTHLVAKARLIAYYIAPIISELKLINFSDYVFYINRQKMANIRDIIEASTELHFVINALKFNNFADYKLDWNKYPILKLGLCFYNMDIKINFLLTIDEKKFSISIQDASFPPDLVDEELRDEKLRIALTNALLKRPL